MMMINNNLEIPFGKWDVSIKLHENDKVYYYNYFMEYWENNEGRFYRWLNDKDIKDLEEHKNYYYSTLEDEYLPF